MSKKGFSLVELMIVVAIIGILAAIAIPNYIAMQLKAKRSEVPGNVDGIKTSELAYDAAFDGYINASYFPASTPSGKSQVDWTVGSSGGFKTIGWAPDGKVRGIYKVDSATSDFTVTAQCNVDGDASNANYTATSSINATQITANDVY